MARKLGREWAEREWANCNQDEQRGQTWYPDDIDARCLVDGIDEEDDDHELATICNCAAAERWNQLAKSLCVIVPDPTSLQLCDEKQSV